MDVVNSLNYCVKEKGLHIYAWCLMSNHLHIICRAKAYLFSSVRNYTDEKGLEILSVFNAFFVEITELVKRANEVQAEISTPEE